jgi:non-canonical purine NTP pyrophosphatase (RdgB/HAM1 family)
MRLPLYACSTNIGKLREFALAVGKFGGSNYVIQPLPEMERIPPPEETGNTFGENAELKAAYYSGFTSEFVFADDSGLVVDALDGEPGIRSARFAGPGASDKENNDLLLRRLEGVKDRKASFVCAIALARAGHILKTFWGSVQGEILQAPQGDNGFGYDPLFFYLPFGKSFAEIGAEKKFGVSHRGIALRALFDYLRKG